ncbi:hypothetical protein CLV30_111132 [Haloactinopolyspora alba]|uniref:Alpha-L-rhamnosidase six-hairpin glycosidase domain-containing protein n=1 Tax=Haloactinopolyspora alba TaxID=648780 RepID=A0A2P8DYB4_9ACTN|nr:hypothetical protein [Haloactinopolyspora alba]PSL02177.1 hypothetical protein CLV30_111132 [Haloactinopolyspora alba]
MGRWAENSFWSDLVERLAAQDTTTNRQRATYDDAAGGWRQRRSADKACMPVLLQGRRLVADVTDRGLSLLPIGLAGRFDVEVGFRVDGRSTSDDALALIARPGESVLEGHGWAVHTRVAPEAAVVVVVLRLTSSVAVTPYVRWVPGTRRGLFLRPADFEQDREIERNNSSIPDPPAAVDEPAAGLAVLGWDGPEREQRLCGTTMLASRHYPPDAVHQLELAAVTGTEVRIALGVGPAPDLVPSMPGETELAHWERVAGRLSVDVADPDISRQTRHSVHNSLFSRSTTTGGREIFVHGRRDRGYAQASHLHQSYQMHLPALAAGEGASVRSELLAYAELQRDDGWIEAAPRPASGWSRYVGRYTDAHLLLAIRRYLSWTGDVRLLDEKVESTFDPVSRRMAERVERAATDLLESRVRSVLPPCGWADAWNPRVLAQGQISAAAVLALRAWSQVCGHLGDEPAARRWAGAAAELAEATRNAFYDPATGLVAEHLFADGVTGGAPDDFWSPTQIWAALAGIVPDRRGLDHVREACLGHGLAVVPETAFEHEYVAASTDSTDSLPVESTATWLLARWPELTHLYALAEIEAGDPDAALAAVAGQLPARLHELDPACAPYYYAEKYLHPGTRPWLCTWAGDPSLIEVVLTGFLGVQPTLDGLRVQPSLPAGWRGTTMSARFVWRSRPYELTYVPGLDPGTLLVDGVPQAAGTVIEPPPEPERTVGSLLTGT